MSDILIKGMEMPKENDYTIVIVYGDGVVTEYHEDYWIRGADGEKQLGIAIPVSPHGNLKDADAIRKDWLENYRYALTRSILDSFDNAPIVISANEEETDHIRAMLATIPEAPTIIEATRLPVLHGTNSASSKEEAKRRLTGESES